MAGGQPDTDGFEWVGDSKAETRFVPLAIWIGAFLTIGVTAVWIQWSIGGARVTTIVTNLVVALSGIVATGVIYYRTVRRDEETGMGWRLVTVGIGLFTVGEILWFGYDLWLGTVPYPGIADVFYLGAYPFLVTGFLLLTVRGRRYASLLQVGLLALLVGLSFLTMTWHFTVENLLLTSGPDTLTVWVSLAYPVFDIVIGTFAIIAAMYRRGRHRIPMGLIAAGFVAFMIVDHAFAASEFLGGYSVTILDTLWITGYLLIALGAVHYAPATDQQVYRQRYSFWELSIPYAPFLAAMAVTGYLVAAGDTHLMDVVLASLVLLTMVLRQLVIHYDAAELSERLILNEEALAERNQELEETTRRLQTILDTVEAAIFLKDTDGRYLVTNQWARDLVGIDTAAEAAGLTNYDVFPDEIAAQIAEAERPVMERGENVTVELEIPTADGPRVLRSTASPIEDEAGSIRGICAIAIDVTEDRNRERRLEVMNEQLALLNRIVRHDIRNDMNVALGWSEELERHVDESGREMLDRIQSTHKHVVDLTIVVRDFVKAIGEETDPDLEPTNLREHLESEIEKRRDLYPDAEFTVDGEVPSIEVRANELLSTVFRNLLNNAVQHNDKPDPVVATTVKVGDETVTVRIADNGPGIPEQRKTSIFGRGESGLDDPATGIGLYLVDSLVDHYGGSVTVEDNDPEGAVFVVELPRWDGANGTAMIHGE